MKKKLLAMILALCLIVSVCAPASAAAAKPVTLHSVSLGQILAKAEETEGVTWAVTDGLLTISGQGAMDDYAQGEAPWFHEEVYSLIIEDGVTHLGSNAFRGMETLMSVTIGTGVRTMGESVFAENPILTDMVIHAGQISIPANSFSGCKSLAEFWFTGDQPQFEKYSLSTGAGWVDVNYDIRNATWDSRPPANVSADGVGWGPYDLRPGESGFCGENVTWQIIYNDMPHSDSNILLISGSGAMDDMTAGEAPWLPYCNRVYTLVVGNGVTAIGASAFDGQHFSEVHIAGSVRQIGAEAFRGVTSLWSVPFTPNFRYIGDRAFADSSIGRVGQAGPMPEMGVGVYENCVKLSYLDLMEGTTVIPARTFAGCTAIKELTLPFTLTAIGDDAFAGCTAIKTVEFSGTPGQWEAIDIGNGNEALTAEGVLKTLPTSGQCGDDATWNFDEATGVLTISGTGNVKDFTSHIVGRQPTWQSLANQITTVVVEEGITRLGHDAFNGLYRLTDVSLPETLTEIGNGTFSHCDNLTAVEFPSALTTIGNSTFFSCDSLETFVIPETITVIPESMFDYCVNLKSITFHDGITSIGYRAFACCRSLTDVELPKNLTYLAGEAFLDCDGITYVEWPASVTTVTGAFAYSGLQEIVIPDTVTAIGARAFDGCTELKSLELPDGVTALGEYAFQHTRNLREFSIPSGVTVIPTGCFSGSAIVSVEIPDTVTTIERYAFNRCDRLESVHLPESVTSIAGEVFTYCSSLHEINWPSGADIIGWHQFSGTALVEFTVPATVKLVESYAFKDCTKLEKLVFEGKDTVVTGSQIFENDQLLTIYCWYDSPAQAAAEWSLIPYVLFDAPADLPRYQVYTTIFGDGTVTATPAESTGFEWITIDVAATDTSVLYDLFLIYYAYEEMELRSEMVDEDTFRLLMPKCDVEIVAAFQNLRTGFIDIKSSDFYYDPVIWAFENNITTGISDIEFGPFGKCQRAQVVTFLWRAAGKPEPVSTENPFVDVKEGDFYYKAVLWAVENGITNGSDDTHFSPYGKCNRAQVVTFLWRAAGKPEPVSSENPFVDVKEGDFFLNAVLWAVENGVTNGIDATHFNPYGVCNRAQVVTFLYRSKDLSQQEPSETHTFTLKSNDPTEEIGFVYCEGTEFAAGESVIFYAEPWYGYVVEFEAEGELELYYLGACCYELIMPDRDVTLTVNFVPAQGEAHFIRTTCENGEFYAVCDMDDDFNSIAKPGEYVQFLVMADDGFALTAENISVTVGGESWDTWWFLGQISEPDPELELGSIYCFEVLMPDADLDVAITCTAETDTSAAPVRISISVN